MSHSRIFDEYAKLMSEKGLLKTADKKDPDYNTIPDKAGPDTKVDETGWELTEIAHPEQIQVSESRLNDGIVENGVERQKAMMDVALRNPRGVLASLMETLVKAANVLDADMTDESLKIAAEVDDMLEKLAQKAMSSEDILPLVEEVLNRFGDLDFSTMGFSSEKNKAAKDVIYKTSLTLKKFLQDAKYAGRNILEVIQGLSVFVKGSHEAVVNAIRNTTDWGQDEEEALTAWDNLKLTTDAWYQEPEKKAPESAGPGVASKETARPQVSRRWSVKSPEVGQLQDSLGMTGADRDEKFGAHTFARLQEAAKTNSLLDQFMESKPKTYEGWTNADIGNVLLRLQGGKKDQVGTPYTSYEEGFQGARQQRSPGLDTIGDDMLEKYPDFKINQGNGTITLSGKTYSVKDKRFTDWLMAQLSPPAQKELQNIVR